MSGALAIFKGLHLYQLEKFQRLCRIRVNITLSRLLRQVLFTLGSPPRYQLTASNTLYGLRFGQMQISPPFIFQSFPEIPPPFICLSFVTNAFPCATSPAENWLIGLLLVPRYVLQMPRTSCKGQVTCFLMLAL